MPSAYPEDYNSEYSRRNMLLRWAGWFFFANLILVLAMSGRYLIHVDIPQDDMARLFTVLVFIGHFASLVFLCYLVLLPFIIALPITPFIMLVANFLATCLVIGIGIDTFIFEQYRLHINSMVLSLFFNGDANAIFDFSIRNWVFTILGIIAVITIEVLLSRWIWQKCQQHAGRFIGYITAMALTGAFVGQHFTYAWADANAYTPITKQVRYLPAYKPFTAKSYFIENGMAEPNPDPVLEQIANNKNLGYPKQALSCQRDGKPYNIFLIVIDSWRTDALHPKTTPNIFEFSKEAWQFNNHYSASNSTRTGIFSLFYGIPGTYWHAMLAEHKQALLVSKLIENKYQLGIFSSSSLVDPEFNHTVFAGIKNLRIRSKGTRAHQRDRNITEGLIKFLADSKETDNPVFAFLFYDSSHVYDYPDDHPLPFQPSWDNINFIELDNTFNPEPFFNRYKNSVNFVDSLIGPVLKAINRLDFMENSVIVITSDHGHEFNDNGNNVWRNSSSFSSYQTRVPLLIRWPDEEPRDFTHMTSHYDIAPTLLQDIFGCSNPYGDYSHGKHLLDTSDTPYLIMSNYSQFAILENGRTYVVDNFGQVNIFDEKYNALAQEKLPPRLALKAMKDMSQFYKK